MDRCDDLDAPALNKVTAPAAGSEPAASAVEAASGADVADARRTTNGLGVLCPTGRTIDASEAERAGLVSRVVPADELIAEALAVAEAVAGMSLPVAMMAESGAGRCQGQPGRT